MIERTNERLRPYTEIASENRSNKRQQWRQPNENKIKTVERLIAQRIFFFAKRQIGWRCKRRIKCKRMQYTRSLLLAGAIIWVWLETEREPLRKLLSLRRWAISSGNQIKKKSRQFSASQWNSANESIFSFDFDADDSTFPCHGKLSTEPNTGKMIFTQKFQFVSVCDSNPDWGTLASATLEYQATNNA